MFGWVCIINMQLLRSVLVNNLAMVYIIIDMQYLCGWHTVVCCGIVVAINLHQLQCEYMAIADCAVSSVSCYVHQLPSGYVVIGCWLCVIYNMWIG